MDVMNADYAGAIIRLQYLHSTHPFVSKTSKVVYFFTEITLIISKEYIHLNGKKTAGYSGCQRDA
jgi:hypothetical protein